MSSFHEYFSEEWREEAMKADDEPELDEGTYHGGEALPPAFSLGAYAAFDAAYSSPELSRFEIRGGEYLEEYDFEDASFYPPLDDDAFGRTGLDDEVRGGGGDDAELSSAMGVSEDEGSDALEMLDSTFFKDEEAEEEEGLGTDAPVPWSEDAMDDNDADGEFVASSPGESETQEKTREVEGGRANASTQDGAATLTLEKAMLPQDGVEGVEPVAEVGYIDSLVILKPSQKRPRREGGGPDSDPNQATDEPLFVPRQPSPPTSTVQRTATTARASGGMDGLYSLLSTLADADPMLRMERR